MHVREGTPIGSCIRSQTGRRAGSVAYREFVTAIFPARRVATSGRASAEVTWHRERPSRASTSGLCTCTCTCCCAIGTGSIGPHHVMMRAEPTWHIVDDCAISGGSSRTRTWGVLRRIASVRHGGHWRGLPRARPAARAWGRCRCDERTDPTYTGKGLLGRRVPNRAKEIVILPLPNAGHRPFRFHICRHRGNLRSAARQLA